MQGVKVKFQAVDRYLIRGPHPTVKEVFQLKKQGVTQIYDFRHKGFRGIKFVERIACKLAGINYIRKPFSFFQGDIPKLQDFEEISKSVKQNGEKGGKTLFHCNSGRHRTSHMAAFYDITRGETLNEYRRKHLFQYNTQVINSIAKHVYNANFFNREVTHKKTFNPIKYLRQRFNNQVVIATKKANKSFVNMFFDGYKIKNKNL